MERDRWRSEPSHAHTSFAGVRFSVHRWHRPAPAPLAATPSELWRNFGRCSPQPSGDERANATHLGYGDVTAEACTTGAVDEDKVAWTEVKHEDSHAEREAPLKESS